MSSKSLKMFNKLFILIISYIISLYAFSMFSIDAAPPMQDAELDRWWCEVEGRPGNFFYAFGYITTCTLNAYYEIESSGNTFRMI